MTRRCSERRSWNVAMNAKERAMVRAIAESIHQQLPGSATSEAEAVRHSVYSEYGRLVAEGKIDKATITAIDLMDEPHKVDLKRSGSPARKRRVKAG